MIGRDLRVIREACDVTMGELAASLGWSVTHLSDVERETWSVTSDEVSVIVSDLARIVRERTPVGVISASDGPQQTRGLAMLRILAQGDCDTMTLAAQMRYPSYAAGTVARRQVLLGHVRVCGRVPSKCAGPPVNVYTITDAGRAFLAARGDL